MSLWKKIVLIVIAAIAVLAIGGVSLYNFVIVPRYIEPVIASASEALKDAEIQDVITDVAKDLVDRGVIDETTFENYMREAEKYTSAGASSGAMSSSSEYSLNTDRAASETDSVNSSGADGNAADSYNETTIQTQSARSALGMANVRTSEDNDSEARVNESYSRKYSTNNDEEEEQAALEEEQLYAFNEDTSEELDPETQAAISESRAERLYDRIMSAMTMHERAVFFSVIERADTNTLMTMYNTSDKEGAKEYLQSILSNDEYSEAVEIFFKYAPMLLEE